jgi:hypothetical protein
MSRTDIAVCHTKFISSVLSFSFTYKVTFGKVYSIEEEPSKRSEWEKHIKMVNAHNDGYRNGEHTWSMGINQFADGTKPATGLLLPKLG